MAPAETERILATAVRHHQAGRMTEAEALYRRLLAANPNHVMGLQFLGILAHQLGRNNEAVDLIGKAIALNDRAPDCHHNIGAALQRLDRLEEAAAHYAKAIALKPDFAEAHYELANVLARQEKLDEAAARYQRALALRPNFVEALTNLGNVLRQLGRLDEAVGRWRQALALQPLNPVVRMNIGLSLKQQGKLDEAVAHFRQALSLAPGYADACHNLGNALIDQGNIAEALDVARHALAAKEALEAKFLLVRCLRSPLVHPDMGDLRDLLLRAMSEPWARPSVLAPACTRFLMLNDAIRDGVARAAKAWPKLLSAEDLAGPSGVAAFAEDRLLRALLESTPVCEVGLERFATGLRFNLLTAARTAAHGPLTGPTLELYCAVARQCFINNYVFAESDAEIEWTRELRDALAAALATGAVIPPPLLVAVAAYVPLHGLPAPESLLERPWPNAVTALLVQQIRAPLEERRARASMPALTEIADEVSVRVRGQYEENPYPQWTKVPPLGRPETADAFIRNLFPQSPFAGVGKSGAVDILVAGCGTGRHPIDAARKFKAARVLAIDLSLTSLCYAQRQTRALGLDNIRYAQADIMKLPAIDRKFDIVESVGVLHHLADPLAGWRALLSMLRPGGIMLVGLYSEIARRDIVAARDYIAERGYRPSAEDIRRCRQELFDCADGTPLKNVTLMSDFFSISECRDLLFHVQEHRLNLPDIAAFIAENNLQFLGFELDSLVRQDYARRFPGDIAMTDLAQWHRYEVDNPRTFIGMYQFWMQKK
ncbi:MAG TPA: tetratricopeptide repeat protein [Xanthobacteraceae bacterium]|nr:tetratricopeptide repeat protein [Xanthobacteraceae bacterium]